MDQHIFGPKRKLFIALVGCNWVVGEKYKKLFSDEFKAIIFKKYPGTSEGKQLAKKWFSLISLEGD